MEIERTITTKNIFAVTDEHRDAGASYYSSRTHCFGTLLQDPSVWLMGTTGMLSMVVIRGILQAEWSWLCDITTSSQ
jgi:hypothetical protein